MLQKLNNQSDGVKVLLVLGGLVVANKLLGLIDPGDPGSGYPNNTEPGRPTLSDQRLRMLADIIQEALLMSPIWEDEDIATAAILECNNNTDVDALINVFGERYLSVLYSSYTLPGAVAYFYDPDEKLVLNDGLRAKGITFVFA